MIADFEKGKKQTSKDSIIVEIANFVTENFNIKKQGSPFEDLKNIYKQKSATKLSIMKVYSCLFNKYEIPFNIVLTSNRYKNKFDKSFFTNSNLVFTMFYFPENKKYLCPSENKHNLGFAPSRYSNNEGIFITRDDFYFKKIKLPTIDYTVLDRKMDVFLNLEEGKTTVNGEYLITGYRAMNSKMAYKHFKKDGLEKFKKMEAASNINDANFTSFSVKNSALKLGLQNIPFVINYTFNTEEILEESGDNYLFNVGKLIGNQSELYQEVKRVNPVELSYPNQYKYSITIKVPKGYHPKNLDQLNTVSTFSINDDLGAHFSSTYTYVNNNITIIIAEQYKKTNMDISYYPKYKDVVNAAYDFSKKVILFEKM